MESSPLTDILSRLAELPGFLANPQENPQLAVISLGMIVAVALILVAILLLTYLRISAKKRRKTGQNPGASKPKPRVITPMKPLSQAFKITVVLVLVFAVFSTGPYSISQPKFCLSCHSSAEAHDSWEDSTHSDIGCLACHKTPGALGVVEIASQGAGNLVASAIGAEGTSGTAFVRSPACLRCHNDITQTVSISNDIRVSHKEFLEVIPACTSCHPEVGHKDLTESTRLSDEGFVLADSLVTGASVMERCASCHDGQTAFSECDQCHTNDIGKQAHYDTNELPKISLSNPDLCSQCHESDILAARTARAKADQGIIDRVCTACHTLERLGTSGIGARGWNLVISRMDTKGADFGPDERDRILNYLQITYP